MTHFEFRLPDVGEGIAEAEVIEWLVSVDDVVTIDQPIAVIETDKSQLELPTPVAGTVMKLHGIPGDVLAVGSVLITIDATGDIPDMGGHGGAAVGTGSPSSTHPSSTALSQSVAQNVVSADSATDTANQPRTSIPQSAALIGRIQASPSTRKLAAQQGIDLRNIVGTGPNGRITASDVMTTASGARVQGTQAEAPVVTSSVTVQGDVVSGPSSTQVLRGVRRAIASSMTASLAVPDIMEFREIDASALVEARAELTRLLDSKVSVTPLLIRAVTLALQEHPEFNARFDGQAITRYEHVHVGIATATDDGLLVPVLHDAQQIALRDLPVRIERLTNAAKVRTATPDELGGGTFTVTNFGSFGTWLGTPIIRVPEVAIAGFGRITDKVVAVDGQAVVRAVLPVVVATDHRVNDGAHLGAFVSTLERLLTGPSEWMN